MHVKHFRTQNRVNLMHVNVTLQKFALILWRGYVLFAGLTHESSLVILCDRSITNLNTSCCMTQTYFFSAGDEPRYCNCKYMKYALEGNGNLKYSSFTLLYMCLALKTNK